MPSVTSSAVSSEPSLAVCDVLFCQQRVDLADYVMTFAVDRVESWFKQFVQVNMEKQNHCMSSKQAKVKLL